MRSFEANFFIDSILLKFGPDMMDADTGNRMEWMRRTRPGTIVTVMHLRSADGKKLNGKQAQVIGGDDFSVGLKKRVWLRMLDPPGQEIRVLQNKLLYPGELDNSRRRYILTRAVTPRLDDYMVRQLDECIQNAEQDQVQSDRVNRPDCFARTKWLKTVVRPYFANKRQGEEPVWECQHWGDFDPKPIEWILTNRLCCVGSEEAKISNFSRGLSEREWHQMQLRLREFVTTGL